MRLSAIELVLAFFRNARPESTEDWLKLQDYYRLAEAIAEPRPGRRAHINRGYVWYFYFDLVAPTKQLEKWKVLLTSAKSLGTESKPPRQTSA